MKDNVGQSTKKTTVKRIVIGIIIACVIVGSSVVVLNWNRIEPTVEKIIQSTSSEPTNITESTQKTIKKSKKSKDKKSKQRKQKATEAKIHTYILNSNTGKFHRKNCEYADTIAEHNKKITKSTREELRHHRIIQQTIKRYAGFAKMVVENLGFPFSRYAY